MAIYRANQVTVDTDSLSYGEGEVEFRWPGPIFGWECLTINADGHCSRRMPIRSGSGPPDFVAVDRERVCLRFPPELAQQLQLEPQVEITFSLSDEDFRKLRRMIRYLTEGAVDEPPPQ